MINRVLTLYPDEMGAFLNDGEPTLEVLGGIDSINIAIAATDEVPDIADDSPQSALAVATDAVSGKPYLAMELSRRVAVDTAILMGLNARDTYPGDVRNNFTLKHHTSDAYGAATAVVPNSAYARIIGEAAAFTRYNGVDAYTSVANNANLNFGASSDYSIVWRGIVPTTPANGARILEKGSSSAGTQARYMLFVTNSGKVTARIDDGTTTVDTTSTTSIDDGVEHIVVVTVDRDGNQILYIDGAVEDSDSVVAVGDIDNTGFPLAFSISSHDLSGSPLECDDSEIIIYNRVLAPKEIEQMVLGVPVPMPLIVGDNSSMNTIGDWLNTNLNSLSIVSGKLRAVNTSQFQRCQCNTGTILTVGHRYLLEWDGSGKTGNWSWKEYNNDLTIGAVTEGVGSSLTFTATNADELGFLATSSSGQIDLVNVYLTDLDALVTFPLVVDQWGNQTNLVTNGEFTSDVAGWSSITSGSVSKVDSSVEPGTSSVTAGAADVGVAKCPASVGGGFQDSATFPISLGGAYLVSALAYVGASGSEMTMTDNEGNLSGSATITTIGAWERIFFVAISTGTTARPKFLLSAGGGTRTFFVDKVEVTRLGAVAAYLPEGISDKWYDRSSNNLDGTNTNVEKINAATGGLKDILVVKFDEIMSANLYMDLNSDGLTGTDNLEVSDWLQAKSFTTGNRNIGRGSYRSPESFPGVTSKDTRGGDSQSSVLYGRRNSFSWTYVGLDDSQVARLKEIYRIQEGTSRLMVLGVQENDGDEIPYPVKFDGPMTFVRKGSKTSVGIKLMEQATT